MLLGERCICSGGKDFPLFVQSVLVFYFIFLFGTKCWEFDVFMSPKGEDEEGENVQFQ